MENLNFVINNVWMMLCIILVFIMHQLNINQTELCQALDISKTLLSDVLNGKKKPNLDT